MPEFIRFGIIGLLGTGLYAGVYVLMLGLFDNITIATSFAFLVSLIFSFLLQSSFTFRVKRITGRHAVRFIIVITLIGLLFTIASFFFGSKIGEWEWLMLVVISYPIFSFLGHKYYTYSEAHFGRWL